MKLSIRIISSILLACFLSNAAYSLPPQNITCAKQAVEDYYEKITATGKTQFDNDVTALVKEAEQYMPNKPVSKASRLAMVLDIDDTSITNYMPIKSRDFKDDKGNYDITYSDLSARTVKPILKLYNDAIKKGIAVFFVTFRSTHNPKIDIRANTIATLKNSGYVGWSGIYLPDRQQASQSSAVYKTKIREYIEKQGYKIILNIGDQESDLTGGHAEHIFKVPNPLYIAHGNQSCISSKQC